MSGAGAGCYGRNNRSAMLRLPMNRPCVENRAVDMSVNPYLGAALSLAAGLEGIRENLDPGEPLNDNLYTLGAEAAEKRASSDCRRRCSTRSGLRRRPARHRKLRAGVPADLLRAEVQGMDQGVLPRARGGAEGDARIPLTTAAPYSLSIKMLRPASPRRAEAGRPDRRSPRAARKRTRTRRCGSGGCRANTSAPGSTRSSREAGRAPISRSTASPSP